MSTPKAPHPAAANTAGCEAPIAKTDHLVTLTSWRTLHPADWNERALGDLSALLRVEASATGEPRWAAAIVGDPAAAVAVALRYAMPPASGQMADLAASTLVAPALAGDAACIVVLRHLLVWRHDGVMVCTHDGMASCRHDGVSSGHRTVTAWASLHLSHGPIGVARRLRERISRERHTVRAPGDGRDDAGGGAR